MGIKKSDARVVFTHISMILLGCVMIYPLVWMFFSSFKTNQELFSSIKLIPDEPVWDSFREGWKGTGQYTYSSFYINTFSMVIPTVVFTVVSSAIVAYGFSRFDFKFKKPLLSIVIGTLLLPGSVLIIPRYLLFNNFDWLNTYLPFTMPALLASNSFFIYMLIQFFRGIPRSFDEAATIDGCNTWQVFWKVLIPVCKPALFSAAIFQFIWTWNDFFGPLLYVNSVRKYPISLALRMSLDSTVSANWNQILAMSVVSLIPGTLLFFTAQQYFIEGASAGGIKG